MNFGNFGMGEMLIILVVVLLLFGAKRIPEIAGSMGKGINEFKRNLSDAQKSITEMPQQNTRSNTTTGDATSYTPPPRDDEDRPEPKRLLM